jgi:hypothetical protein
VPSDPPSVPRRKVCQWILRTKFNEGQYLERIASGELTPYLKHPGRPAPPGANEPPGTLSQFVRYRDSGGIDVVKVHRYLRPDGSIGGSSRLPDPKWLLDEREVLQDSHGDEDVCPDCQVWRPRALAAQGDI